MSQSRCYYEVRDGPVLSQALPTTRCDELEANSLESRVRILDDGVRTSTVMAITRSSPIPLHRPFKKRQGQAPSKLHNTNDSA